MPTSTALLAAQDRALRRMREDPEMVSTETAAGTVLPVGRGHRTGTRKGYMVFVKVCRFDERLLAKKPITGGLY